MMADYISSVQFAREVDMYPCLLRLFSRFDSGIAEVPFFGKRIDLLFSTPSLLSLYAVETKLYDWRSAFKQAALNQLAAQRSFVALPLNLAAKLRAREADLFHRYDVGLIAVGADAMVLIPPKKNGSFSLRHHQTLKKTLRMTMQQEPRTIGVVADALADRSRSLVVLQTRTD